MRFLNLLYLSIGKSDRTLNFFRQNIMVIGLYIALVQKKSAPLRDSPYDIFLSRPEAQALIDVLCTE